jgi:hypothetical protein
MRVQGNSYRCFIVFLVSSNYFADVLGLLLSIVVGKVAVVITISRHPPSSAQIVLRKGIYACCLSTNPGYQCRLVVLCVLDFIVARGGG